MNKNQCDGCNAGKPVDEHGNHVMGERGGYRDLMACQKARYESDYGSMAHPNQLTSGARAAKLDPDQP